MTNLGPKVKRPFSGAVFVAALVLFGCSESTPSGTGEADAGDAVKTKADGGPCAPLTHLAEVIQVYGGSWNEPDAVKRGCALERALDASATYVDPTIDVAGVQDLVDAIGNFQKSAPTASIVIRSGLDARAGELRFAWELQLDGAGAVKGLDFMELAKDGRIATIRGYWDPIPNDAPAGALAAYVAAWTAADATARKEHLALAVSDDVRFTSPGTSTTGRDALSDAMESAPTDDLRVTGTQPYPKHARITFASAGSDPSTPALTDYLLLGPDGKITRIARFEGPLPPE